MMQQRNNGFLEGAILPSLLKFAVPVLLALVLQALYGAVDLWAVGKFGTTADISAVSTGSQTMQIITGIVTGLSMGTTILLGQRIGQVLQGKAFQQQFYTADLKQCHLHRQSSLSERICPRSNHRQIKDKPRRASAVLGGKYARGHHSDGNL